MRQVAVSSGQAAGAHTCCRPGAEARSLAGAQAPAGVPGFVAEVLLVAFPVPGFGSGGSFRLAGEYIGYT